MPEVTVRYLVCVSCGADERDQAEHIALAPGNAFVKVTFANVVADATVLDDYLCSLCWCDFQHLFLDRDNEEAFRSVVSRWTKERVSRKIGIGKLETTASWEYTANEELRRRPPQ